jgi:long-chain acyl-CoA synthetase
VNLGYQILEAPARRFPDRVGLLGDWGQLTFAELATRAGRVADGLTALGVRPGDRVGYMMNNHPDVVAAYFGILRAGGVAVAVNVMLKAAELTYLLNDSGASVIVCEPAVVDTVLRASKDAAAVRSIVVVGDEAPGTIAFRTLLDAGAGSRTPIVDRDPDDVAMIMYTSGTTGAPKGVMMTHAWLDVTTLGWISVYKLSRDDRFLVASPFFYAIGSVMDVLAPFRAGASAVLLERYRPRAALDAITRYRPTGTVMVPTAAVQLVDAFDGERDDVSSVEIFFTAGSPCPDGFRERLRKTLGWELREIYGLTEAHMVAAGSRGLPRREGMIGVPGANVVVRIVDDGDHDVARGEVGEIICKGDTVTAGYWGKPTETAEAHRGGWFHTGDLGMMDADGYVKIVDRKKEMIITGGANIYPAEVERVLVGHPAVATAAVVGIPDATYGEMPCAVIVLRPGAAATADEVIAWSRARLAAFKCPRSVRFVDEVPLTASGKIARRQLRMQLDIDTSR